MQRTRAKLWRAQTRFEALPGTTQATLWALIAGLIFSVMNMLMRHMTLQMHPSEVQFLRQFFGLLVMLPLVFRSGLARYKPSSLRDQVSRGFVHMLGVTLWFVALPYLALADITAIGFTGPIFTMLGAAYLLHEKMRWDRWVAALAGFVGVLIVIGPRLSGDNGWYSLIMLAAAVLFSLSFLLTKMMTRRDSPQVIVVWQTLVVALMSLPMAIIVWRWPSQYQWLLFFVGGVLGSSGHFCLTHSLKAADMSATQSVKYLDLIWATIWGLVIFGDQPSGLTFVGGAVIICATIWIARREARANRDAAAAQALTATPEAPR